MDTIIATQSAEILRFSNIALILSYYDYLDQWKKVMKRLCKLAQEQWMNNENAFINFGEQVKRDLYITSKALNRIQWVIQDRHFLNKILLERDEFNIYVGKIAMKLKPGQVLNMNLHADDTDYIELHFGSYKESNKFIPSLKGLFHKPISKVITEGSMLSSLLYLKIKLDFYSFSIQKNYEEYEIKQMFSPIIKATAYSEVVYSNKELNIKSIYSGEKGECGPHTIRYNKLSDANKLLSSFGFGYKIDHFVFELNKEINPLDFDNGIPLHTTNSPLIEIRYKNHLIERTRSDKDLTFCVYLNKRRFKIRTQEGYYLIEMNPQNFVIGGNEDSMQSSIKGDWLFLN